MERTEVNEKSLGTIFRELSQEVSVLVRSEVALAKLEMRESIGRVTAASSMFIAAVVIGLIGLTLVFVTAILVLALFVPAWAATLIVGVLLIGLAALLAVFGKKKIASVEWVPNRTIESIRTDINTIKDDITRIRER